MVTLTLTQRMVKEPFIAFTLFYHCFFENADVDAKLEQVLKPGSHLTNAAFALTKVKAKAS